MQKPVNCVVEGCPSLAHAKGYCRRHYGQIWRHGTIYNDTPKEKTSAPDNGLKRDDRLKALERELKKAQQMYEVVVGFHGRIKWRREMEAVQYEIRKLTENTADMRLAAPEFFPAHESSATVVAVKSSESGRQIL
jgi:hypothetical protein